MGTRVPGQTNDARVPPIFAELMPAIHGADEFAGQFEMIVTILRAVIPIMRGKQQ